MICESVKNDEIDELSRLATEIVREHFDPLIGTAQNDYMLEKFQTPSGIQEQFENGYQYYWVMDGDEKTGFLAFYPKEDCMYLSKFYVHKNYRGRHLAAGMIDFVIQKTKEAGLGSITLNVNRGNTDVIAIYKHLGFEIIREEKNDIGSGFFMDDYVLQLICTS